MGGASHSIGENHDEVVHIRDAHRQIALLPFGAEGEHAAVLEVNLEQGQPLTVAIEQLEHQDGSADAAYQVEQPAQPQRV